MQRVHAIVLASILVLPLVTAATYQLGDCAEDPDDPFDQDPYYSQYRDGHHECGPDGFGHPDFVTGHTGYVKMVRERVDIDRDGDGKPTDFAVVAGYFEARNVTDPRPNEYVFRECVIWFDGQPLRPPGDRFNNTSRHVSDEDGTSHGVDASMQDYDFDRDVNHCDGDDENRTVIPYLRGEYAVVVERGDCSPAYASDFRFRAHLDFVDPNGIYHDVQEYDYLCDTTWMDEDYTTWPRSGSGNQFPSPVVWGAKALEEIVPGDRAFITDLFRERLWISRTHEPVFDPTVGDRYNFAVQIDTCDRRCTNGSPGSFDDSNRGATVHAGQGDLEEVMRGNSWGEFENNSTRHREHCRSEEVRWRDVRYPPGTNQTTCYQEDHKTASIDLYIFLDDPTGLYEVHTTIIGNNTTGYQTRRARRREADGDHRQEGGPEEGVWNLGLKRLMDASAPSDAPSSTHASSHTDASSRADAPSRTDTPSSTHASSHTDASSRADAPSRTDTPSSTHPPSQTDAPSRIETQSRINTPSRTDSPSKADPPLRIGTRHPEAGPLGSFSPVDPPAPERPSPSGNVIDRAIEFVDALIDGPSGHAAPPRPGPPAPTRRAADSDHEASRGNNGTSLLGRDRDGRDDHADVGHRRIRRDLSEPLNGRRSPRHAKPMERITISTAEAGMVQVEVWNGDDLEFRGLRKGTLQEGLSMVDTFLHHGPDGLAPRLRGASYTDIAQALAAFAPEDRFTSHKVTEHIFEEGTHNRPLVLKNVSSALTKLRKRQVDWLHTEGKQGKSMVYTLTRVPPVAEIVGDLQN